MKKTTGKILSAILCASLSLCTFSITASAHEPTAQPPNKKESTTAAKQAENVPLEASVSFEPYNMVIEKDRTFAEIFPDENLAKAVAAELRMDVTDKVTSKQLESIEVLHAVDMGIQDLTGISTLKNAWSVLLGGNEITILPDEMASMNFMIIDLTGNKLSDLPESVTRWKQYISTLDLGNNNFTSFPLELMEVNNVRRLGFQGNPISDLPDEIGELSIYLEELDLSNTHLTKLPATIGNLRYLKTLKLSGSSLTCLPPEIGNMASLKTLRLANANLTDLPTEFGRLTLTSLDLANNNLSTLPEEVYHLSELTFLNAESNQITVLSDEIGNLKNLSTLYLSNNQLTTLPAEIGNLVNLKDIRIANNQLDSLPAEIENLVNLTFFQADQNKITSAIPLDEIPVLGGKLMNQTAMLSGIVLQTGDTISWDQLVPALVKQLKSRNYDRLTGYWTITTPNGETIEILAGDGSEINRKLFVDKGTYTVVYKSGSESGYRFNNSSSFYRVIDLAYTTEVTVLNNSGLIEKITLGTYDAVIDNQTQSITFRVPLYEQDNGQISGNITALEGDKNYVTFLIGGVEYKRYQGEYAAFSNGDKVYIDSNTTYTIRIENANVITKLSLDSYKSRIDNDACTITFTVPAHILRNGNVHGLITELDDEFQYITFLIGGVEYRRSVGESAGFQTGDKVYISNDRIYTIILEDAKQISSVSVDGFTTVKISEYSNEIVFAIPDEMRGSNGVYTGTLTGIEAEANADTLVFVVGGGEYPRQVGASVAFNDGDQIYISKDHIYTIRIVPSYIIIT